MMSNTQHLINRLGHLVDRLWAEKGRDELEFPAIAYIAMLELRKGSKFTWNDIAMSILEADALPDQRFQQEFGEPGIQVFVAPDFFIEVLFWLDGSPTIHQHGFAGAFFVLEG